jgi:hypothetical protein
VIRFDFELPLEERGRQSKKEPILQVARSKADFGLDALDQSRRLIIGYRFMRSREDQPALASFDHQDPKTIDRGRPHGYLRRTVAGNPSRAQPANISDGQLAAETFRLDPENAVGRPAPIPDS